MITASNREKAEEKAIVSGADTFLSKPINTGILIAYMESLLRRVKWDRHHQ